MPKKALTWVAVAFLVFFVAYKPASAAHIVKEVGAVIVDITHGFVDFVTNLV